MLPFHDTRAWLEHVWPGHADSPCKKVVDNLAGSIGLSIRIIRPAQIFGASLDLTYTMSPSPFRPPTQPRTYHVTKYIIVTGSTWRCPFPCRLKDRKGILHDLLVSGIVRPICLPEEPCGGTGRPACFLDRTVTIAGWGSLAEKGGKPTVLQFTQVTVVPNKVCHSAYLPINITVNDHMICAGHRDGGRDTCQVRWPAGGTWEWCWQGTIDGSRTELFGSRWSRFSEGRGNPKQFHEVKHRSSEDRIRSHICIATRFRMNITCEKFNVFQQQKVCPLCPDRRF